jgi:hypothetical protein
MNYFRQARLTSRLWSLTLNHGQCNFEAPMKLQKFLGPVKVLRTAHLDYGVNEFSRRGVELQAYRGPQLIQDLWQQL